MSVIRIDHLARVEGHGGITVDDRNKNSEYDKKSEMYLAEFRTSIRALKVRLNIQRGFGTLSSTYSRNW